MTGAGQQSIARRASELVHQHFRKLAVPIYFDIATAIGSNRAVPRPYLRVASTLIGEFGFKTVVEAGTARRPMNHPLDGFDPDCCCEGHSTIFFALTGADVFTVDINPRCAELLVPEVRKHRNLHVYTADALWFLRRFDRAIDVLYLDAWDVVEGTGYAEKHMEAYRAALPLLAPRCLVLIDDTDILNGGKGRLVIPQMIRDGFDLVTWGRQAMLVRE